MTAVPAKGPVSDKVLPTRIAFVCACSKVDVEESRTEELIAFRKDRFCIYDSSKLNG
jgi:hypothetical protein